MITTITSISASDIPAAHNVRNTCCDDWTLALSEDPEHQVQILGTIPQLAAAVDLLAGAVRTAEAMQQAKRVSAAQNVALAERAIGTPAVTQP